MGFRQPKNLFTIFLDLRVDANQDIFVGGQVIALGEGVFRLPEASQ